MPGERGSYPVEAATGGVLAPLLLAALMAAAWQLFPDPVTPLLVAAALLGVVVAWLQPAVPALFCIAFSAFRLQEAYPVLHPYQLPLLTAAWASLGLAMAAIRGHLSMPTSPFLFAVVSLIVWTSIVCLASTNTEESLAFWSDAYVKIVIVGAALALLIRSDRDFMLLHGTIVFCGVALGVAAFWNYALGDQFVEGTRVTIGRALGSPLGDPNDLALMLAMSLAFALTALAAVQGVWRRLLMSGAAALIIGAISLTQSRGGLLAVAAVLIVVAWRRVQSKGLAIALCLGGAFALYAIMDIGSRVSGGRGEEGFGASADIRLELWKLALRRTVEHPIFGIGPQTFYRIAEEFTGQAITVHNTLIQIAVEAGLPGLAAFAFAMAGAIRANARAELSFAAQGRSALQATALGSQGMLAAYAVAGLFLSQAFNWSLYLTIAAALALRFRMADPLAARRP